ncbi:uncharacterized protein LOC112085350 [Eutrema salsugineum]|uniref:uncharacterized protein LOC112085350 n=1 Tax=Eutrema salsugineum TaxID=72664 RepID=UPI000CED4E8D|nr:uncharacterized protein LOC112085350 [Eutrema salsugineum]
MDRNRCRRHRNPLLRQVEEDIKTEQCKRILGKEDIPLWRGRGDIYRQKFSSKETWENMRNPNAKWDPWHSIWFSSATPKFSFVTWLAAKNRLSTGDRMIKWNSNVNPKCVLCGDFIETRDHLFFECTYTQTLWKALAATIMGSDFTITWASLVEGMSRPLGKSVTSFITRYVFQAAIYSIWCERNGRRHGEQHNSGEALFRKIDRIVRNRLSTIQNKMKKLTPRQRKNREGDVKDESDGEARGALENVCVAIADEDFGDDMNDGNGGDDVNDDNNGVAVEE